MAGLLRGAASLRTSMSIPMAWLRAGLGATPSLAVRPLTAATTTATDSKPRPQSKFRMATHRGNIQIIFGPMFSGKSTELLRRMKRYAIAKQRCFLIKYSRDMRYSLDGVSTHDRQEAAAKAASVLSEVREEAFLHDVIGVDEGQFFPDIVEFCEEMANEGKTVIVAALDGTFQRKPFGRVLDLIPLAESICKLNAVCVHCSADAPFSQRLGTETEVEVIGGAEKYVAVCRGCFQRNSTETPTKMRPVTEDLSAAQRKLFAADTRDE
eukprot:m.277625 g.277625  ORF g.277625 m.277625 type:complete len:267 (+) comp54877_c0_seq1:39-839(+)